MRIRSIERPPEPASSNGRIVLRQTFSHLSQRCRALLLACGGALIFAPFGMVLATAPARAQLATMPSELPLSAALLAVAAIIGVSALMLGIIQGLRPAVRQRNVMIDPVDGVVEVDEWIRGRRRQWREAISEYQGVRHQVATTSEGAMHAVVLQHRRSARSIHIAYEMNVANQVIAETAERLGLEVLEPGHKRNAGSGVGRRISKRLSRSLQGWLHGHARSTNTAGRIANA
jgi:hypothetical protein